MNEAQVRADGQLLCEPAIVLPMAQRYFLFGTRRRCCYRVTVKASRSSPPLPTLTSHTGSRPRFFL